MFNQLIHLAVAPKKKRLGEREKSIFSTAVFFLAFALCLFPSVAWGQAATGQLRGTVTDPSGAILAGATVTVTNQDTGVSRDVTSNESGDYLVTLLPPGTYRIEVKIEGFKQFTLDNVPVRITETTVANAKLEVGAGTSEIITVTSETPLVRTDSATGGRVIEERSLRQLPLPTRNFQQLLTLSAGTSSNITNTSEVGRGDTAINVNGQRTTSNSVLINGIDANSIGTGSTPNLAVPATDALQEFIVQTSQFDASQGRNAGGIVTAVTKSGTNEFHGNAYYFLRNEKLNANNFFLNGQGVDRPKNNRHQFGGTFGGPIVKDKVWFFGSYQGTRETNGTSLTNSLATAFTSPDLTDDRSLTALAALSRTRAPLFGGYVNPVSIGLLQARYPNGEFLIPSGNGRSFRTLTSESTFDEDQFNANVDAQVTSNNRLGVKFFFANNSLDQGLFSQFGLANALQTPGYPVATTADNRFLSVTDTHVFGSGIVNEFRFGYNAIPTTAIPEEPFTAAQFGISTPNQGNFSGLPAIALLNQFTVGPSGFSQSDNQADTLSFGDTVTWTKGRHSMKFGGEYRYNRVRLDFDIFARGSITFTGGVAAALAASRPGSITRPDAFTELLVAPTLASNGQLFGLPSIFSIIGPGSAQRAVRSHDHAFFFQDDYRVNNKLTLNLGVRYDYYGAFYDTEGRFVTFDDTVPGAGRVGTFNGFFQADNAETPLAGIPTLRKSLVDPDRNNFAPRFGFAYNPFDSGKFVIRGGYGVYYDRPNARAANNQGLSFPYYTIASILPGTPFSRPFSSPFAPIPQQYPLNLQNRANFPTGGLPFFAGNVPVPVQGIYPGLHAARTPYIQQYTLGFQWEFMPNTQLEVTFVGSQGRKLSRLRNVNTLRGPNQVQTGPFSPSLSEVVVQGFGVHLTENTAKSNYNSLQVSLTRRYSNGLQGLVAYTYSHAIDEYSGQGSSNGTSDVSADFGNQGNFAGNRATADFDRRHRLVVSMVYDLPAIYKGDNVIGKSLVNNWQLSGVFTGQTGSPFSVINTAGLFDSSRASYNPLFGGDPNGSGPDKERLNRYFNTSAFILSSGNGNFGTTGRNILTGPGQTNTDISVVKFIPIKERHKVEFRAEFYNIFNQTNFANPVNVRANPNFGRIVSTSTGPRLIQFAFKYSF